MGFLGQYRHFVACQYQYKYWPRFSGTINIALQFGRAIYGISDLPLLEKSRQTYVVRLRSVLHMLVYYGMVNGEWFLYFAELRALGEPRQILRARRQ